MTNQLIYTIGPSGAGKDSLLLWLRQHIPPASPIHWARRTITRASDAGGESHEAVTAIEFEVLQKKQAFAMHWHANSLSYGIRHKELHPLLKNQWVILNGSRAYLPIAARKYPQIVVMHITASPEILRQRLLRRGRETPEKIEARIQRQMPLILPANCTCIEVKNDGDLTSSGQELLTKLERLPGWIFKSQQPSP